MRSKVKLFNGDWSPKQLPGSRVTIKQSESFDSYIFPGKINDQS